MARRCDHSVLLLDDFIEPGGAFASCLLCPIALELSTSALEHYLPFEHTSPSGPENDRVLLVRTTLLEGV